MTRSPGLKSLTPAPTAAIDAGGFVAHDDRRDAAAGGAVVAVDVAAADAAGGDANQDFAGGWLRVGKVGDFELQ